MLSLDHFNSYDTYLLYGFCCVVIVVDCRADICPLKCHFTEMFLPSIICYEVFVKTSLIFKTEFSKHLSFSFQVLSFEKYIDQTIFLFFSSINQVIKIVSEK